ncbi:hypothetical protein [Streptomyces sp. NPDC002845]
MPTNLENRVKSARKVFLGERHRHWQEHYNAACVYAIAMSAPGIDGSRDRLARLAYKELENAVRGAESSFVMLQRSWMLAEDPDLAQLRTEDQIPHLARFEREAYPHPTPDRRRFEDPRPIHIEMAMNNSQLLRDLANVMELTWHNRSSQDPVDTHDAIKWFEDEELVWEFIHRVASSQARNWPDRERLLQKVQEIADPSLLVELPTRVPEFNDVLDDDEEWGQPESARRRIDGLDDRLTLLGKLLKPIDNTSPSPIKSSAVWLRNAEEADADGATSMRSATVRQVCTCYSASWQTLRSLIVPSNMDSDPRVDAFEQALQRLPDPHPTAWLYLK